MKLYQSQKTYGNEVGFSCCFRQHKATSHCSLLHGYSIGVRIKFETEHLDHRHWVIDFGGMKQVKEFLKRHFDHTLLVADDDPMKDELLALGSAGLARVIPMRRVGCEAFAEFIFDYVAQWVTIEADGRVRVQSVEVFEHGSNSASVSVR